MSFQLYELFSQYLLV